MVRNQNTLFYSFPSWEIPKLNVYLAKYGRKEENILSSILYACLYVCMCINVSILKFYSKQPK
jgi:hypothetical protein